MSGRDNSSFTSQPTLSSSWPQHTHIRCRYHRCSAAPGLHSLQTSTHGIPQRPRVKLSSVPLAILSKVRTPSSHSSAMDTCLSAMDTGLSACFLSSVAHDVPFSRIVGLTVEFLMFVRLTRFNSSLLCSRLLASIDPSFQRFVLSTFFSALRTPVDATTSTLQEKLPCLQSQEDPYPTTGKL
jgi:hypothetical protein